MTTIREPYYIVVAASDEKRRLAGLPTPALIAAGGGEAYRIDDIWYLRDDARGYVAEAHGVSDSDGKYHHVRVMRNPRVAR